MTTSSNKRSPTHENPWDAAGTLLDKIYEGKADHITTWDLLDFAAGGLDRELLVGKYGPHLDACDSCSRAVKRYEGERVEDPTKLDMVPEFSHVELRRSEYPLDNDVAKLHLKKFIDEGSGSLVIVGGEANPFVYDDEIAESIEQRTARARASGSDIPNVLVGPVMGLGNRIQKAQDAILPNLASAGIIKLLVSRHRQLIHFRISNGESVAVEAYHQAGDPKPRRGAWYKSRAVAGLFKRRFDAVINTGLARSGSRDDFHYMQMERIREIQKQHGPKYDYLTVEDLRSF